MLIQPSVTSEQKPSPVLKHRKSQFFKISEDRLTVSYTGKGHNATEVGCFQCTLPARPLLGSSLYYFEVRINNISIHSNIMIGFTDPAFPFNRVVGKTINSYGLKCDGKVFHNSNTGVPFCQSVNSGDVVGVGLNFETQEIFITINGWFVGVAFKNVRIQDYYASVSLQGQRESVTFNFQDKFLFDLEGMVQELEVKKYETVLKEQDNPSDLHELVYYYLLVNGYEQTLEAFSDNANMVVEDKVGPPAVKYIKENNQKEYQLVNSNSFKTPINGSHYLVAREPDSHVEDEEATLIHPQSLKQRGEIRQLVITGDISKAIDCVESMFPGFLQSSPDTLCGLLVQQFIELISAGLTLEAMNFAKEKLQKFQKFQVPFQKVTVSNVLGLLCYLEPQKSPLGFLLEKSQRYLTADMLNKALLVAEGVTQDCQMELALKQLLLTQQLYFENQLLTKADMSLVI